MTTVTRRATTYTVLGTIAPGGISTSDSAGGVQVVDDAGDLQLQDATGSIIVISREEFAANWVVVTP